MVTPYRFVGKIDEVISLVMRYDPRDAFFYWLCGGYMPAMTPSVIVLGTSQDGGYPQAGCTLPCCMMARENPALQRTPCSLGLVDPISRGRWIFDCTPEFSMQLHRLNRYSDADWGIQGIFLTHAHIGHYLGLLQLGKEVMSTTEIPVYVMPRMESFLQENEPWAQLVYGKNIKLVRLQPHEKISLGAGLSVHPIPVPHRDELSETVAFEIEFKDSRVAYLPDIDSWESWDFPVLDWIRELDCAWLDGTFFSHAELPGRDRSQIPHPSIQESQAFFRPLEHAERAKIRFMHLNHTNPLCLPGSVEARMLHESGYGLANEGDIFRFSNE